MLSLFLYFVIISDIRWQYPKVLKMGSCEDLFPDDLRFEGFEECAKYKDDMKEIRKLWEYINTMYSFFLQVQVCHRQWIPLLVVFVQKWSIDYVPVDIERSFVVVEEEQPVFKDQCHEWILTVEEINNHRETIEQLNSLFPRVQFYQNHWIPRVKAFIRQWSSGHVPDDIKRSLAVVKEMYPINL